MKLVMVEWEDASVVDSETWVHKEGMAPAPAVVFHTVGWLHELTHEAVVLTDTTGKDHIGPRQRIPAGMVRRITEFGPDNGTPLLIPKKKRKR